MQSLQGSQLLTFLIIVVSLKTATSINCYVCDASNSTVPFQCGEWFDRYDTPDLKPLDCRDVHDAKYCIKHVGRYEGGLGSKRYCSSKNLGNYCDYVQNRGDKMEYRSCIYTCGTDGCNGSNALNAAISICLFFPFCVQMAQKLFA